MRTMQLSPGKALLAGLLMAFSGASATYFSMRHAAEDVPKAEATEAPASSTAAPEPDGTQDGLLRWCERRDQMSTVYRTCVHWVGNFGQWKGSPLAQFKHKGHRSAAAVHDFCSIEAFGCPEDRPGCPRIWRHDWED